VTSPMSTEDCVSSLVFFHSVRCVCRAVTISVLNVRCHWKLDLVISRWAVPELRDVARCCIIGSPDFLGICRGSTRNTQPNTTLRRTREHVQVAVSNGDEVIRGPKSLGRSNTSIDE
jgi:hypothetical protein